MGEQELFNARSKNAAFWDVSMAVAIIGVFWENYTMWIY
jgi:hypothetical protein